MTRASRVAAVLAVVHLVVVVALTIGPAPWRTGPGESDYDVLSLSTWLDPDTWRGGVAREFTANILLFVPLGALLRWTLPRGTWVGAALLGTGFSFVIEVLQMWTPRVSDPRDVVANGLGALAGALLAAVAAGIRRAVIRMRESELQATR